MGLKEKKRIVLIGAGNLATHLGHALNSAGHQVVQVYSRTKKSATELATKLNALPVTSLNKLPEADIYIIAVKDDAIAQVCKSIKTNGIVIHTSGSTGIDVIKRCSPNAGVLYPLQTFSKKRTLDFSKVPLCVEATNHKTERELLLLARGLSENVTVVDSEKRKTLHLAAVFACNFSNHMFAVAETILKKDKLPFSLLIPLIEETTAKIKSGSPEKMQTGPAARQDVTIMKKHLKMLGKDKQLQQLYSLVSKNIIKNKA